MKDISLQKLNTPLYDAMCEYVGKKPMRFHMPSHKGMGSVDLYSSAPYDITELDFSDNLLKAEGVIRETEKLFAKTYGVDEALMFTCGATSGLYAALYCVKQKTNKIILSENSHKSIYNAISVMGLEPCFCPTEYDLDGVPLPITADLVKKARVMHPDAGAVLVTTPDYFGRVCEMLSIKEACKDLLLVSDSSHGGHFVFAEDLQNRAEQYADITVLSLHKTLNCYTGSCVVLCKNEFYRILCKGRELFHTTSPHYLCMASMDYSRGFFEKNGSSLYGELKSKLYNAGLLRFDNYDFCKVVLEGGEELSEYLKQNGIYPECVYGKFVILIFTPFDTPFVDKLKSVLDGFALVREHCELPYSTEFPMAEEVVSFSECFSKSIEYVRVEQASGRILAGEIGLYPPGVPIMRRGQKLNDECVQFLLNYKNSLFGVDSDCVCVLK